MANGPIFSHLKRILISKDSFPLFDVLQREFSQKYLNNLKNWVNFKKNLKFETNIEENDRLAVAIASEKADYTVIRQILDYLFRSLGLKYEVTEADHSSFIEGRLGRVIANGKKVAYIGEINPIVLQNWAIEVPVTAFELNLTDLYEIIK